MTTNPSLANMIILSNIQTNTLVFLEDEANCRIKNKPVCYYLL